jgi:hypothetical protein
VAGCSPQLRIHESGGIGAENAISTGLSFMNALGERLFHIWERACGRGFWRQPTSIYDFFNDGPRFYNHTGRSM